MRMVGGRWKEVKAWVRKSGEGERERESLEKSLDAACRRGGVDRIGLSREMPERLGHP
jgi:hypothetical protein